MIEVTLHTIKFTHFKCTVHRMSFSKFKQCATTMITSYWNAQCHRGKFPCDCWQSVSAPQSVAGNH